MCVVHIGFRSFQEYSFLYHLLPLSFLCSPSPLLFSLKRLLLYRAYVNIATWPSHWRHYLYTSFTVSLRTLDTLGINDRLTYLVIEYLWSWRSPDSFILAACNNERFPVTNIQPRDGITVEWEEEHREKVILWLVFLKVS